MRSNDKSGPAANVWGKSFCETFTPRRRGHDTQMFNSLYQDIWVTAGVSTER